MQIGNNINGFDAGDGAGESVSISSDGNTIAVGATGNDNYGLNRGLIRVYNINNLLGIDHFYNQGLKIYPTPASNYLYINNTNIIISVEIYNLLGQKVYNTITNTFTEKIDMSIFNSGIYHIKTKTGKHTVIYKVLKK